MSGDRMRCCRTITGIISARNSRRSDGQIPPPPRKSWAISRRREGGCEDRAKGNRVLFLGWDLEEEEESGVEEEEEKKNDDDDDDDGDYRIPLPPFRVYSRFRSFYSHGPLCLSHVLPLYSPD
mmetsp:Transcript_24782/g.44673  ORF Transcript_24782/g.44673 Transcript_24782/m.44673 type:complete len:123 (+) Transcript_24782:332-700(+)